MDKKMQFNDLPFLENVKEMAIEYTGILQNDSPRNKPNGKPTARNQSAIPDTYSTHLNKIYGKAIPVYNPHASVTSSDSAENILPLPAESELYKPPTSPFDAKNTANNLDKAQKIGQSDVRTEEKPSEFAENLPQNALCHGKSCKSQRLNDSFSDDFEAKNDIQTDAYKGEDGVSKYNNSPSPGYIAQNQNPHYPSPPKNEREYTVVRDDQTGELDIPNVAPGYMGGGDDMCDFENQYDLSHLYTCADRQNYTQYKSEPLPTSRPDDVTSRNARLKNNDMRYSRNNEFGHSSTTSDNLANIGHEAIPPLNNQNIEAVPNTNGNFKGAIPYTNSKNSNINFAQSGNNRGGAHRNFLFFINGLRNMRMLLSDQIAILEYMQSITPVPILKEKIAMLLSIKKEKFEEITHLYDSQTSSDPLEPRRQNITRGAYVNLYAMLTSLQNSLDQYIGHMVNNRACEKYIDDISVIVDKNNRSKELLAEIKR
ncbi:MAG: hypothetical protein LBQ27_05945 [Clostridiales bacterium]|jgi:hypothetical protein|nr:hypothetical protein [Clostridiales bacterium]